jgi:intein/homing endonuclease
MRLKFVKGKQRELINSFRIENKLSWNELCKLLSIKYGKIIAYFNETSFIDEELYKKLDKKGDYSKYILDKFEDNWGRKKGGVNSKGNINKINFPEDSKELAEFYGIMLGDGNSYKRSFYNSKKDKCGTYSIKIVGDSVKDKDYLFNHVKPLIDNLFVINSKLGKFNSSNAIFVQANGVQLVNFLENKGFKPGNKITNQLRIPEWITSKDNFLISCIRGLYDTDGSVYKITNQNSYQICFTNHNIPLLKDVRDSLLKLGINCSNISKYDVYITKKSELRKFLKLIGFSNHRHIDKINMWKLDSPMV